MITLINVNRMLPPIAPIGLDYVAGALRRAGIDVQLLDLCMAGDGAGTLAKYFEQHQPELIGISFRNVDDCFWPSARSFLPTLRRTIDEVRQHADAPIVLGGVGYSIMPDRILDFTGAEFGVHGDGEEALPALLDQLQGEQQWARVPGLVYRTDGQVRANQPAWPRQLSVSTKREFVDNRTYFRRGGQIGAETKRGCSRRCVYCVDPLAKGNAHRLRDPSDVADEVESLLRQGVDVLHLCDAEFNLPSRHAEHVCDELIRRDLGQRVQWYAYLAVVPFSRRLVQRMRRAGCVGINFTSDSAHAAMLSTYGQPHRRNDLADAVQICREERIAVMLDLLLGGPGENAETVSETIEAVKQIDPDCAGAALGIRVYPGTPMEAMVQAEGPLETNPSVLRHYTGPVDLLQPTFYISSRLGRQPGRLVRELIGDDPRFFPPDEGRGEDASDRSGDHNYNENQALIDAIETGARGAYWDVLRRLRIT